MPGTTISPAPAAPDPRLRQRDYLLQVAQALSADLDLPRVLARVIRAAVGMTGGQAGAIALRQADGVQRVVARYQLEERFEHALDPWLEPGTGAGAEQARGSGGSAPEPTSPSTALAPVAWPTPSEGIAVLELRSGPESASQVLALPLEDGEGSFGRIFVFRSEGAAAFTSVDTELLKTFADQAAIAIQNAETHRRLAARERRLAAVVEHGPAGSLLLDAQGRVHAANPAALALLGSPTEPLEGRRIDEVLVLEDSQGLALALDLPVGPQSVTTAHGVLRRADGRAGAWVQVAVSPLPGLQEGRAGGYVVDLVDLSGFKEAEAAGRAFLAGLSHELKTPLALIRGYAETLRLPQVRADPALVEESLGVILDETEQLTRMVDQLLEAARVDAGGLRLDLHLMDLGGELARMVEAFRGAYPDRDWSFTADPPPPPIQADPARLRAVFQDLLSNAVKYSEPGARIAVRATGGAAGVGVVVTDTGIGLAPADRGRIFQRFFRADDRGPGTGLGLYMARAIVEAHGGSISVESAPGEGSSFRVELPLSPPPGTA